MRKVVIDQYQCEVCGTNYESPEQAVACEAAGRPAARYSKGASVRFRPEMAPEALREERFSVEESLVTLHTPARAGGQPPSHVVSYVLLNGVGRVGFIAEHQLTSAD